MQHPWNTLTQRCRMVQKQTWESFVGRDSGCILLLSFFLFRPATTPPIPSRTNAFLDLVPNCEVNCWAMAPVQSAWNLMELQMLQVPWDVLASWITTISGHSILILDGSGKFWMSTVYLMENGHRKVSFRPSLSGCHQSGSAEMLLLEKSQHTLRIHRSLFLPTTIASQHFALVRWKTRWFAYSDSWLCVHQSSTKQSRRQSSCVRWLLRCSWNGHHNRSPTLTLGSLPSWSLNWWFIKSKPRSSSKK